MLKKLCLGAFQSNCYILYRQDGRKAVVIDPGFHADKICDALEGMVIEYIFLTHAHIDHISAAPLLKERFDCPVAVHEDDNAQLLDANQNLSMRFGKKAIEFSADILVKGGEIISTDAATLEIIHTPGHSRGGICIKTGNNLFTGDTLFKESIGATEFYGGDYNTLIQSIESKLMTLDDNTVVYPGHGDSTTIGAERKNLIFYKK